MDILKAVISQKRKELEDNHVLVCYVTCYVIYYFMILCNLMVIIK